jgi:hypothetical protein
VLSDCSDEEHAALTVSDTQGVDDPYPRSRHRRATLKALLRPYPAEDMKA